jgi:endonuclease YncB( thermonuclease family)
LAGVKIDASTNIEKDAATVALAQAALTKWVSEKHIRYFPIDSNKAYIFVFPNKLECRCVNLELIRDGKMDYNNDTSIPGYTVLLGAQNKAKAKEVGIWAKNSEQEKSQPSEKIIVPRDIKKISTQENEKIPIQEISDGSFFVEAKKGKVKSIVSTTSIMLEDATTTLQLAGVKNNTSTNIEENTATVAVARTAITNWVFKKQIRYISVDGNKVYIFVFPNELECRCVNLELIREGRLKCDNDIFIPGYTALLSAQSEAKANGAGVWSKQEAAK